ncbi:hypothetical protein BDP81DRAFT_421032 [Colletotrichum phormii]|uniref:Secreted protein n=1 Tax=Colletotrichum phormii TaxID=359342 RepID=A0AAJ0EK06_9PEZI|nr:uncharacterized protein BDP81DRAFT_421032 [Colletotrichum phormii]KAK1639460.1 hypothetical protein BDP81DRAFT_421032 [Colletotrichum phormii]
MAQIRFAVFVWSGLVWSAQVLLSRYLGCDTRVSLCSSAPSLTYSRLVIRFSSLCASCCWAGLDGWWHCVQGRWKGSGNGMTVSRVMRRWSLCEHMYV